MSEQPAQATGRGEGGAVEIALRQLSVAIECAEYGEKHATPGESSHRYRLIANRLSDVRDAIMREVERAGGEAFPDEKATDSLWRAAGYIDVALGIDPPPPGVEEAASALTDAMEAMGMLSDKALEDNAKRRASQPAASGPEHVHAWGEVERGADGQFQRCACGVRLSPEGEIYVAASGSRAPLPGEVDAHHAEEHRKATEAASGGGEGAEVDAAADELARLHQDGDRIWLAHGHKAVGRLLAALSQGKAGVLPLDNDGCPMPRCAECSAYHELVRPGKTQPTCLCEAYRNERERRTEAERERDALRVAIKRGCLDLCPCRMCGLTVACIPDGLPYCEECAAKEAKR